MEAEIWKAHCLHMAEATHAIADWCDDPEMLHGYLALAAKWLAAAERPPASGAAFEPDSDEAAEPLARYG